jgi:hypothetical protein
MADSYDNLPFARGATYGATATTDATHLEGREFIHIDRAYGTGLPVRVRCCRNNSGAAILPKFAVKFNLTAGKGFYDCSGRCTVTAERTGICDEFLPSAGVPDKDLFWVVIEGPTLAKTDLAGADNNVINVGDPLWALTAATTGATTSGRVYTAALTGATAVLAGGVRGVLGHAMSAKTTANTNADVLINAGKF